MWWSRLGSNQRPPACEAGALPLSYETEMPRRRTSKVNTRRHHGRTRCLRSIRGAPIVTEKFVRSRLGGLSSCFAPDDDLVRGARM